MNLVFREDPAKAWKFIRALSRMGSANMLLDNITGLNIVGALPDSQPFPHISRYVGELREISGEIVTFLACSEYENEN